MSADIQSATLPYSAASVAGNGSRILISDRSGTLLFWDWPIEQDLPAPSRPPVRAHGDWGPITTVGPHFATSGGWDPSVTLWDGDTLEARYQLRPFDGRVTALAAQGDFLLVAGADRAPAPRGAKNDQVYLRSGSVWRVALDGRANRIMLPASGQIASVVATDEWLAIIDGGQVDYLSLLRNNRPESVPLVRGPATALAAEGDNLYIADRAGIWRIDIVTLDRQSLVIFDVDSPRLLLMQALGDSLYGGTSEGLIRWSDGRQLQESGRRPLCLSRHGDRLLVLSEGGLVEQREPISGRVLAAATVPSDM